ncbi:MAG: phosphate regulon transcriptional regulator PhoB [Gammaproteobacteria bacterium]|nr:phosphate regulon transcriptional regulator PhoB [Gammaproteobacteria bacterium]
MQDHKNYQILIVEDEHDIREMLRMSLERESYRILDCETAEEATDILEKETVHLVLLDWMLPGMSGIDFAKQLRRQNRLPHVPVIMLTAKAEEDDKLNGFDAGIDDYISKPFSLKELLARIQSVLRRSHSGDNELKNIISLSGVTLDKESHLVYTDNNDPIHLGPTEFKLLQFLMINPGRVYSRDQLLDHVWGVGVYVDERTVDVHIRRLRKALGEYDLEKVIRTVRGSGYSFIKPRL